MEPGGEGTGVRRPGGGLSSALTTTDTVAWPEGQGPLGLREMEGASHPASQPAGCLFSS